MDALARRTAPILLQMNMDGKQVGYTKVGGREGRPYRLEASAATCLQVAKLRDEGMTWSKAEMMVAESEGVSVHTVQSRINKLRLLARMLREHYG